MQNLAIGLAIAAIPGPVFFELTRRTLTGGFWSGASLAAGEFVGNFSIFLLIFLGLSGAFASTGAQLALSLTGTAILFLLGISALRTTAGDLQIRERVTTNERRSSFWVGVSIAASSPIVISLWISLTGSYLQRFSSTAEAVGSVFLITFSFMLFFVPLAALIHHTRRKIPEGRIVLLSRILGAVLVAYGVSLAYQFVELTGLL